ncbi:MAG: phosphoenolpyruvate carboxykinase [Nitrospirota bacterium]|nr:phosphoenolpyruvate carboxykinase [Nitrospirota bacterium]
MDRAKQLEVLGLRGLGEVHWNLSPAVLYEEAVRRGEGNVASGGPLVVHTGNFTGRAANDKFIVDEPGSRDHVAWGEVNKPVSEAAFDNLLRKVCAYFQKRDVFVQDLYAGQDDRFRMPIRVITQSAWHSLFANNLFVRPGAEERASHAPEFTVLHAPGFEADPKQDGTRSGAFVFLHLGRKLVLIGGTHYAGEIKKSIFSSLNYLLPLQGVMSMHCSANIGADGNTALFFGLSGTGKTTLSADPERGLIGDDEHGWSDSGVFNYEGGCYAKVINLSPRAEPEIFACTRRFGTVLENVVMDPSSRELDLDAGHITENTRAAYPIDYIPNAVPEGRGGHPRNVIFLTCDAFGVMPPIARLTPDQAMYHFLSGYTAKVAGTEAGIKEPRATFSTCFGAPFMPLHPGVYAKLLGEKIQRHDADCWLINTGWTGGGYGVGSRMSISHTRAMVHAALDGALREVEMVPDPVFGLAIPKKVKGVAGDVLQPRNTWVDGTAYDAKAKELARLFHANFAQYASGVSEAIRNAGPLVG